MQIIVINDLVSGRKKERNNKSQMTHFSRGYCTQDRKLLVSEGREASKCCTAVNL